MAAKFSDLSGAELAEAVMPHWQHLTVTLPLIEEPDVVRLLKWELTHRKNRTIIVRLHQRFTRLRGQRERIELLRQNLLPKELRD